MRLSMTERGAFDREGAAVKKKWVPVTLNGSTCVRCRCWIPDDFEVRKGGETYCRSCAVAVPEQPERGAVGGDD